MNQPEDRQDEDGVEPGRKRNPTPAPGAWGGGFCRDRIAAAETLGQVGPRGVGRPTTGTTPVRIGGRRVRVLSHRDPQRLIRRGSQWPTRIESAKPPAPVFLASEGRESAAVKPRRTPWSKWPRGVL